MEEILKRDGLKMDVDRAGFALALRTWRLRKNYTQREVAKMFGCSRWTVMKAECGKEISWMMAYRLFAKLSDELVKEGKEAAE